MPIGTILMIVVLIGAILVLAIGLRPPREDLNAKKDK